MKYVALALLVFLALAGCSQERGVAANGQTQPGQAPSPTPTNGADTYLAYEHSIRIATEAHKVAGIFDAALAACHDAIDDRCTVLESRITTGPEPSASLKFRATSGGIRQLISVLNRQAEITEQSTTAEDLAAPIADVTRQQAMLNDYRSKLEALLGRAHNDVEALIKVNRELAQVQSELETSAGKQAYLVQRVGTEILNVGIGSILVQSTWRPIANALSDFGGNLSDGIAAVITAIAFLVPWVLLLVPAAWLARRLWRRRG